MRELELAVLALRRQRLTLVSIAAQLGLSRSTVARICARAGLQRLSRLQPPLVVQRYERCEPGELLHLDIKKLGRIERIGHRITGYPGDNVNGAGWEFVHVGVVSHGGPQEHGRAFAFLALMTCRLLSDTLPRCTGRRGLDASELSSGDFHAA